MRSNTLPLAVLTLTFASATAFAQPQRVRRPVVVRVDRGLLFVDSAGTREGATYRVYRSVVARHPVTGQRVKDRYPIGVIEVTNAGNVLSVAHAHDPLERPAQAGDTLEATEEVPTLHGVAPASLATPSTHAPGLADDEAALLSTWVATLGQPPRERVRLFGEYLRHHPSSPRRAIIQREIAGWESLHATLETAGTQGAARTPPPLSEALPESPAVARELTTGDAAVVALHVPRGSTLTGGVLHVRRPDATQFETVPLASDGDGYLRARVPTRYVTPEIFEYFVELVRADGSTFAVLGTATDPVRVGVNNPPAPAVAARDRTRIDLRAEFADVGSRTNARGVFRRQQFVLVEGDFLQRLDLPILYGYRVGFGVYAGEGTPLARLDADTPTLNATVIYGYHEIEFEISQMVHVMVRGQIGVHASGLVGGAQLRLRIGAERGTNVVVGGDAFNEVGQKAFFAFNFAPHARVPVTAFGEVFHQTVAVSDPMFRIVAQTGYRITPWWTISARGSYQLRNVRNGGFGGGLSMTFDW